MKTTIDVDREAAEAAAGILGTSTLKDTVNAALREVLAADTRRALARQLRRGEFDGPTAEEIRRLEEPPLEPGALDWLREWRR